MHITIRLLLLGTMLATMGTGFQSEDCQPRADWVVTLVTWADEPDAIAERAGITADDLAEGNCWDREMSFAHDVLIRVPPEFFTATSTAWEIVFPKVLPDEEICNVIVDEFPQVMLHPGEEWQPIGYLAWYAPLTGFTSTGYVINLGDGREGWVSEVGVHLEGDCQPMLDSAFTGDTRIRIAPPDFSTGLTRWTTPRHVMHEPETVRIVLREADLDSERMAEIPSGAWVPVIETQGQMKAVRLSPHHTGWTSVFGW